MLLHGRSYDEAVVKIWRKSVEQFKSCSTFSKISKFQNGVGRHLGFWNSSFWHSSVVERQQAIKLVKFDYSAISGWKVITIFVSHRKCIGGTKNWGVLEDFMGENWKFYLSEPQRHLLTPKHVFWRITHPNRSTGLTCIGIQETEKNKKQNRHPRRQCWGVLGKSFVNRF